MCRATEKEGKNCYFLNRTAYEEDPNNDLTDFEIKPEECPTRGEYEYEVIHEKDAVEKMKSGSWFNPDDSIVLDIDEDYFGCESAAAPLMRSGAPWARVRIISALIDTMICPKRTKHENEAEDFLMPIINEASNVCSESDINCTKHQPQINKFATEMLKLGLTKRFRFLCSYKEGVMLHRMKTFVKHLLKLNKHQIKTISTTGLCMMTTPKSAFFADMKGSSNSNSGSFHICTGFNSPNATIVTYHYPKAKEVETRIETLREILVHGVYPNVKLVTLCRSVRDGYTPRGHFEVIERGILGALRNRLGQGKYDIYYDKDLLGGQYGWPSRHTVL